MTRNDTASYARFWKVEPQATAYLGYKDIGAFRMFRFHHVLLKWFLVFYEFLQKVNAKVRQQALTVISEIPQLSSQSDSDPIDDETEAKEAATTRRFEAFDRAALTTLNLSKEVLKAVGKGDKAVGRAEVGALRQKYEEVSGLLDEVRKAVGDEVMNTIEAMRLSREEM